MHHTLLFDLNGTLLDLSTLDPLFERLFGSPTAREEWFKQLQVLWLTDNCVGQFRPFAQLADAALRMLAAKRGAEVSTADRKLIKDTMTQLPAFPDVAPGLARLMAKGHRLATLTNGAEKSAVQQVKFARLNGFFGERVYSVDAVDRYKPAPEPYAYAAGQLEVPAGSIIMVAAHAWDLAGARAAGLKTAFVRRPGQVLDPDAPEPEYDAENIDDLAAQLGA